MVSHRESHLLRKPTFFTKKNQVKIFSQRFIYSELGSWQSHHGYCLIKAMDYDSGMHCASFTLIWILEIGMNID